MVVASDEYKVFHGTSLQKITDIYSTSCIVQRDLSLGLRFLKEDQ